MTQSVFQRLLPWSTPREIGWMFRVPTRSLALSPRLNRQRLRNLNAATLSTARPTQSQYRSDASSPTTSVGTRGKGGALKDDETVDGIMAALDRKRGAGLPGVSDSADAHASPWSGRVVQVQEGAVVVTGLERASVGAIVSFYDDRLGEAELAAGMSAEDAGYVLSSAFNSPRASGTACRTALILTSAQPRRH